MQRPASSINPKSATRNASRLHSNMTRAEFFKTQEENKLKHYYASTRDFSVSNMRAKLVQKAANDARQKSQPNINKLIDSGRRDKINVTDLLMQATSKIDRAIDTKF